MRLVDLRRTTSFRLALGFLLLFGAASLGLCGFLYWQAKSYIDGRVDDWIQREQAILDPLDADSLRQRLNAHVVADPTLERPLTLYDPAGNPLAGTALRLPQAELATMPRDTIVRFAIRQGRHDISFRGLAHVRPSGDLLLVARDMEDPRAFGKVLIDAFLWGGLVTMLLGLAGAAVVGADAVRRIDAVTRATQRIIGGNLSERLPTHGRADDFDRLINVINVMLGEIERLMQEVKGVCDNIAHDLRTPLTRLLAGLERTQRRATTADDYAAAVDEAVLETKGLLQTFTALLRISEVESGARRSGFTDTDLAEILADAVELYEPMAEARGVRLRLTAAGPAVIRGDPSLLFEAAGNLVDNALKFTQAGGCVTVSAFHRDGTVGFEVADTGPGIPPTERDDVLLRFYRSEASRNTPGSGLGLALVAAVAALHGMDLAITDARPGCRITITRRETGPLPRTVRDAPASEPAAAPWPIVASLAENPPPLSWDQYSK